MSAATRRVAVTSFGVLSAGAVLARSGVDHEPTVARSGRCGLDTAAQTGWQVVQVSRAAWNLHIPPNHGPSTTATGELDKFDSGADTAPPTLNCGKVVGFGVEDPTGFPHIAETGGISR